MVLAYIDKHGSIKRADVSELCRLSLPHFKATGRFGLDVFWEEPPDPDDPIFQYNVLATPHIGGSTDVSIRGIVAAAAENIRRVARNQGPLYLQP